VFLCSRSFILIVLSTKRGGAKTFHPVVCTVGYESWVWLVRCDAIAEFMHVRELLDRLWGNNCFECYRLRLSGYFIYQRVFLLAFSLFFSFLLFLSLNLIALGKTSDNGGVEGRHALSLWRGRGVCVVG